MLDIGEVARRSGLPASTLRYYEEKGLIRSVGRQAQKRVFDRQVLEVLAMIALGRAAGFSLDEIGTMVHAGTRPRIDRAKLLAKADQVEQSIRQLKAVRDGLRHTAVCPEKHHLDCPVFQRLMRAATAGDIQPLAVAASKAKARQP